MRPLTASHRRRNSFDERLHGKLLQHQQQPQQQPTTPAFYTPQKPQAKPDLVTPLSLSQIGQNPFTAKHNLHSSGTQSLQHDDTSTNGIASNSRDFNHSASLNSSPHANNGKYLDERVNNDSDAFGDRQNHNQDGPISPEDFVNTRTPNRDRPQQSSSSFMSPSPLSADLTFVTTSSSYGSHSPMRRAPSPGPRSTFSATANGTASPSYTTTGIFGTSVGIPADPGIRGRSPTRRPQSPARYYPDETVSSPSRLGASDSLDRTHVAPKELSTFGAFNQNFRHPMKFEKNLTRGPHETEIYKDHSIFPPKRETVHTRSPVYRLDKASKLNSREMDHLETSMREALSTIDSHEQKVNLLSEGGYRALSPEPRLPSHQDKYVPPQSRSIFSSIQPTGSPVPRSVSPALRREEPPQDGRLSRTELHKKFHSENPDLKSSSPAAIRIHPNSVSRQAIFPS